MKHFNVESLPDISDLLVLHQQAPITFPHLLQSQADDGSHPRYDILFATSDEQLIAYSDGTLTGPGKEQIGSGDFLTALDNWWQEEKVVTQPNPLPFTGGWFFYLGYELAGQIEHMLKLPANPFTHWPVAFAMRCRSAVIRDHKSEQTWLVYENDAPSNELDAIRDVIQSASAHPQTDPSAIVLPPIACNFQEEEAGQYMRAVQRIKHYIYEGDIFQANLSREWHGLLSQTTAHTTLYALLRQNNPAPFAALSTFAGQALISSSPERLISIRGSKIETRPIAGTRPRYSDRKADTESSESLRANPKEQAEHIMLVDLERNDLGRVCTPGSVIVTEIMAIESYAHVHHIVSTIQGQMYPDKRPGEALRAVFPGGTITGCPKVRCMEILAELEQQGRGFYTGSLGYLNRNGDLDSNILIRTLWSDGQHVQFRTGGGIVADSDPKKELKETRDKAKGLLKCFVSEQGGANQ